MQPVRFNRLGRYHHQRRGLCRAWRSGKCGGGWSGGRLVLKKGEFQADAVGGVDDILLEKNQREHRQNKYDRQQDNDRL
jgi:hypothetical protein